jgi:hypothetical protein
MLGGGVERSSPQAGEDIATDLTMRLTRRLRLRVALLTVLGLLFAQAAVAALACERPATTKSQESHAGCEGMEAPASSAVCHKHCIGDEGGSPVFAGALVALPVDLRAAPFAALPESVARQRFALGTPLRSRPPPLTILLGRFLT